MIICPNCKKIFVNNSFICDNCNQGLQVIDNIVVFHPELSDKCNDYDSSGLDVLFNAENSHFWFIQRKKVIKYIIDKYVNIKEKIIEIGSGTGNVTKMIKDAGYSISVGEIHLNGLKYAKGYGITNCFQFDLFQMPFVEEFDTICMFDVLEHLDDENRALFNIAQALKINGKLIITVPSYNCLWSRDDTLAHHKRRYTKKNLETTLIKNGFSIIKSRYFFASIMPLLFLRKIIYKDNVSSNKDTGHITSVKEFSIINIILNIVLSIEFIFFRILPLPFGGSIIAVARKLK